MSFRRAEDSGPESSRWRLAHRALLSECGIPDEVADSDRRWIYVLLHGTDEPGTGWQTSWISPAQAARLLTCLVDDLSSETGYHLVHCLRARSSTSGL